MVAKGDGPAAAANPTGDGFSGSEVDADLKTGVVDLPREPKGDCSELAKAAKLDEANAEDEVTGAFLGDSSSLEADSFEEASEPNGETAEVFENALVRGCWGDINTVFVIRGRIQTNLWLGYSVSFLRTVPVALGLSFPFLSSLFRRWSLLRRSCDILAFRFVLIKLVPAPLLLGTHNIF